MSNKHNKATTTDQTQNDVRVLSEACELAAAISQWWQLNFLANLPWSRSARRKAHLRRKRSGHRQQFPDFRGQLVRGIEELEGRAMLSHNMTITSAVTTTATVDIQTIGSERTYSAKGNNANVNVSDIISSLNSGSITSVVIYAGNIGTPGNQDGDLTVSTSMSFNLPSAKKLSFRADDDVKFISSADVAAIGNKLDVTIASNWDNAGLGGIALLSGTEIRSNGGDITLGGTNNPLINHAQGTSDTASDGIYLEGATLASGAGNISLRGQGQATSDRFNFGVQIDGSVVQSTSGNITISGVGGGTASGLGKNRGVSVVGGGKVEVATGQMTVTGKKGLGDSSGVRLVSDDDTTYGQLLSTGSGTITVNGFGGGNGANRGKGLVLHNNRSVIGGPSAQGNITLIVNEIEVTKGSIQSSGTLTIRPSDDDSATPIRSIGIGSGVSGDLLVDSLTIASLEDGFKNITIGDPVHTSSVNVGGATFLDPVTILGNSTISASGVVTLGNSLATDNLDIKSVASLGASGGSVTLQPNSINLPIRLGAEQAGELSLTDAEFDRITTTKATVGSANSGSVVFSNTVSPTNAKTLEIITHGNITQNFVGTAFIGNELDMKGNLAPASNSTGVFKSNSSIKFDSQASYEVTINSSSEYDKLVVDGNSRNISLNGAELVVAKNYAPSIGKGDVFRIIDSTGNGSTVIGTFKYGGAPLNNLATFNVSGTTFLIEYNPSGSSGDVTLTEFSIPGNQAPKVTQQPTNTTVTSGASASFSAAASGNPTPSVQWWSSTDGGGNWTIIDGATSTTYSFTANSSENGNQYHAVFTNDFGSATTDAATLTVTSIPSVTTQPSNTTVLAGTTASFTATASGSPTPRPQWWRSSDSGSTWSIIPGATSTTYSFTATLSDSGNQYRAVFDNGVGSPVPSNAATLTVVLAHVEKTSIKWGPSGTADLIDVGGGRLLPVGRTNDIDWFNIDRITITLDRPIPLLNSTDVSINGVVGGSYAVAGVSGAGNYWTITLAKAITSADNVTVTVGNGQLTPYPFRLDILPGDFNDDGVVSSADITLLNNASVGPYALLGDLNGDGINDGKLARAKIGTKRIV